MRTISASQARQGFAELLESTHEGPVMVERQKRGVAVVMSVADYDRLVAREAGHSQVQAPGFIVMEPLPQPYGTAQLPATSVAQVLPRKKRQMGTLKGKLPDFEGFDDWMTDEIAGMFNGSDSSLEARPVKAGETRE